MPFYQEITHASTYPAGSASGVVVSAGARAYYGCSVRETAGAAAVVRIRDGSSTGNILEEISLAANADKQPWHEDGVEVDSGAIFVERVSGSSELVIYWG